MTTLYRLMDRRSSNNTVVDCVIYFRIFPILWCLGNLHYYADPLPKLSYSLVLVTMVCCIG
jgi:hypothetical protein